MPRKYDELETELLGELNDRLREITARRDGSGGLLIVELDGLWAYAEAEGHSPTPGEYLDPSEFTDEGVDAYAEEWLRAVT